jgi:hypothetical protein
MGYAKNQCLNEEYVRYMAEVDAISFALKVFEPKEQDDDNQQNIWNEANQ